MLGTRLIEKTNANKPSYIKCARDPDNKAVWVI